ncbi:MAG: hypothetical protein RBS80_28575 [Thermoguttaceae bacterium]|nr:hypothetical protein [Thermoguttaceae bacterium]
MAVLLSLLAVPTGVIGLISLILACLRDHDISVGVANRLEFLEELVYLERLSLERKERRHKRWSSSPLPGEATSYEETGKRAAA